MDSDTKERKKAYKRLYVRTRYRFDEEFRKKHIKRCSDYQKRNLKRILAHRRELRRLRREEQSEG